VKVPNAIKLAAVSAATVLAIGCGAGAQQSDEKGEGQTAPAPVQIGQENVVVVKEEQILVGPIVSGELRAEREATVRAEVGGSMLQVSVEEGQAVRRGALLGRIEATTLDDAVRSAQSAVTSSQSQLELAQREVARAEQLVGAGALAQRDLDVARANVSTAQAQLADARSRVASAQKQLGDAVLRSPIDGVVAERAVNAGDVVTPGTELFTIVDPSSMQLEASVPSEDLAVLRPGVAVQFTVRGYADPFEGRIERISPRADSTTRQVPIFVAIPNSAGRLVAGLFAEGRVVAESARGLVVPLNAVNTNDGTWVLRVANGKTDKVNVTLGLRDPRTERVQVLSGLNAGDVLLRGAAQGITPGTPVSVGTAR
jgi:membrane fusion protein, multidrug efflux system